MWFFLFTRNNRHTLQEKHYRIGCYGSVLVGIVNKSGQKCQASKPKSIKMVKHFRCGNTDIPRQIYIYIYIYIGVCLYLAIYELVYIPFGKPERQNFESICGEICHIFCAESENFGSIRIGLRHRKQRCRCKFGGGFA